MGEIKLSVQRSDPGIHLVKIEGELDLYSTSDVKTLVQECLDQPVPKLLLDLSNLQYLDSSGVGLLISIIQKIRAKSGSLQVFGLHGSPKLVLDMCKILQLIPQCDTIEKGYETLSRI